MFQKNFLLFFLVLRLTSSSFCQNTSNVVTSKFPIGSSVINHQYSCFGPQSGVVFINFHENENTSVAAGKFMLDSARKYCLSEIKGKKTRLINFVYGRKRYIADPNRIFTRQGAEATLKKNNGNFPYAVLKSVLQLASHYTSSIIDDKKLVVALHNNSEGGYSILSYQAGGEFANDAEEVFLNRAEDPDDFYYTTERKFFDALKAKNHNAVLQHSTSASDDGSLSVYCAAKKIPYINIEAEQGQLSRQKEMVRMVLELAEETGRQ